MTINKQIYVNNFISSKNKIKDNENIILKLEKTEQDKKEKNRLKNKKKKQIKKRRLHEEKEIKLTVNNNTVDEFTSDVCDEITNDVSNELLSDISNETTSDISNETTSDISNETTIDVSNDSSSDLSSENTANIYDDIYTVRKPLIKFHSNLSISKTEMKQIINLLNNLYYDNDTHAEFLYRNNFTKIKVLKKIHFGYNETDPHFNIRYINTSQSIYSNEYHMYINEHKISRMTKLDSTVFS